MSSFVMSCDVGEKKAPATDYVKVWCATNRPIVLTPETVATLGRPAMVQAMTHNRYGAAKCGWKP